jgi:hypothetical protein
MVNTTKEVGPGKVIIKGGFVKAFRRFTKEEKPAAMNEICAMCYWSIPTFWIKLTGRRPLRKIEVDVLNKFFAQRGIDAWTGEPLNKN